MALFFRTPGHRFLHLPGAASGVICTTLALAPKLLSWEEDRITVLAQTLLVVLAVWGFAQALVFSFGDGTSFDEGTKRVRTRRWSVPQEKIRHFETVKNPTEGTEGFVTRMVLLNGKSTLLPGTSWKSERTVVKMTRQANAILRQWRESSPEAKKQAAERAAQREAEEVALHVAAKKESLAAKKEWEEFETQMEEERGWESLDELTKERLYRAFIKNGRRIDRRVVWRDTETSA